MSRFSPKLICQGYTLALLLAVTTLSPLPHSVVAMALLLIMLFSNRRPLALKVNLAILTGTVFLTPILVEPILKYLTLPPIRQTLSAISILPLLYLLDRDLRHNAQSLTTSIKGQTNGKHLTDISKVLGASSLLILVVSPVLGNMTLLLTDALFILYLVAVLTPAFLAIPRQPVYVPSIWRRTIAGTSTSIPLFIDNQASVKLHSSINAVNPWVKVTPHRLTLNKTRAELNLYATPPLAGPARPQLQFSAIDPRGFLQVSQVLEPIELHVIPRAKYAEWLAKKYLEQAGAAVTIALSLMPEVRILKRGIEYYDSRYYQPGDPLKDIDWKHTLKLNRLTIKQYFEASERVAIIGVNLSVSDATQADTLAFNLISTALTLAQEAIPTALAVYNHQKVILMTPVLNPKEILKRTLSLIKDITIVEFTPRVLQLPDLAKLERDIHQLRQVSSEPAKRLLNMLNFEYQAIKNSAKSHPATLALTSVTEHAPAPATIILISHLNHDAEALAVMRRKLTRQEFMTIPLKVAK